MASSFSIRHTKTQRKMTYTGDLQEAIQKAQKELRQKENDQKRAYLLWHYEQARKELTSWDARIDDLKAFIRCATEQLEKEKGESME